MLVKDCISTEFPILSKTDSPVHAYELFKQYQFKWIPIVDMNKLIGMINEQDVLNDIGASSFEDIYLKQKPISLFGEDSLLHAMRLMENLGSDFLPVIKQDNSLIGVCFKKNAMAVLAKLFHYREPGSELFILAEKGKFRLHELIRLIEVEGATVLACTTTSVVDEDSLLRVCVKLLAAESLTVISSLQRHGYVLELISDEAYENDFSDKADAFLHFLNI